jgi:hypothetical protein
MDTCLPSSSLILSGLPVLRFPTGHLIARLSRLDQTRRLLQLRFNHQSFTSGGVLIFYRRANSAIVVEHEPFDHRQRGRN